MENDFDELKKLLRDKSWPEAAPKAQICDPNSEQDKTDRADEVISTVFTHLLTGKAVLDLGCGGGHVAHRIQQTAMSKYTVGYDIKKLDTPLWAKKDDRFQLTDDREVVKEKGPYEAILLYDVLDHTEDHATAIELLKFAKSIAIPGSKIYVRNHPWCGRHGGHLYQQINKSHTHVIFTDDELAKLGFEVPHVQKLTHPQKTYSEWFRDAGLGQPKASLLLDDISSVFERGVLRERLRRYWKDSFDQQAVKFPRFQLRQTYIDYLVIV